MGLFLVELSPQACWHIAAALDAHARALGLRAPLLADLSAAMGTIAARDCPGLPAVAEIVAVLDDRRMEPLLLSVRSAAHVLGVGERTMRRLLDTGAVPSVQVGTRRLVHRADLEAYAERLRGGLETKARTA